MQILAKRTAMKIIRRIFTKKRKKNGFLPILIFGSRAEIPITIIFSRQLRDEDESDGQNEIHIRIIYEYELIANRSTAKGSTVETTMERSTHRIRSSVTGFFRKPNCSPANT